MAATFKQIKDSHGRTISIEFNPSLKMLRVLVQFNKAENQKKSNEDICKSFGVTESEFASWWKDYVVVEYDKEGNVKSSRNYFEEWWLDQLQIKSGEEKEMLRAEGMRRALTGKFNYWKELSRTYGAITPESITHTHVVIPFNLKENATREEIESARKQLMESQRSLGTSGGLGLARLASKGSKSTNS